MLHLFEANWYQDTSIVLHTLLDNPNETKKKEIAMAIADVHSMKCCYRHLYKICDLCFFMGD